MKIIKKPIIIDNFLDKKSFKEIKEQTIDNLAFPWFLNKSVSQETADDGIYFTHVVYAHHQPNSEVYEILHPLITKLDPFGLMRIKMNFYPTTKEIHHHNYHQDYGDTKHHGCIFYLNTNNGMTIFKNGHEIKSIENRLMIFDPSDWHKSTTCSDDPVGRFNINMNFFECSVLRNLP